jgi:multisubunit Na+/H+ antiporter MnhF subunit
MNPFLAAAVIMLAGLLPLGLVCFRSPVTDAVVALEAAGSVMVTVFVCLAEGFHRSSYYNLPVVCAVAVWVSGLVFARFLGRLV